MHITLTSSCSTDWCAECTSWQTAARMPFILLAPIAGLDAAFNKFKDEKLDVLAGLRPGLLKDIEKMPGAKILDGKFSAVQQAVGTAKANVEGAKYLAAFVEEAKRSGLVAKLIERHNLKGLSVAPPA